MCLSDGLQHQFDTVDEDGFTVHAHDAAVLCLAAKGDGAGEFCMEEWPGLQQV